VQITVRVPDGDAEKIDLLSKRLGLKKSDIIRLAVRRFVEENSPGNERTPPNRVKDLVGCGESRIPDFVTRHRDHLLKRSLKQN
jgi:Ribbon-helix-helix protein, copG family